MAREIILDTETTGTDQRVDRIIEIAAIEVEGLRETGRVFHRFYDPGREIAPGATEVHGMTWADLKGKPRFEEEAAEFAAFVSGATLVIHNAPFDIGMMKAELHRCRVEPTWGEVVDTLPMARKRHPGQSTNLDALCDRYGIDRSGRGKHGGLIDVKLLHQVYIRLSGIDQLIPLDQEAGELAAVIAGDMMPDAARQGWFGDRGAALGAPTAEDEARHAAFVAAMAKKAKGPVLWGVPEGV